MENEQVSPLNGFEGLAAIERQHEQGIDAVFRIGPSVADAGAHAIDDHPRICSVGARRFQHVVGPGIQAHDTAIEFLATEPFSGLVVQHLSSDLELFEKRLQ
jgi:hypothetical protein